MLLPSGERRPTRSGWQAIFAAAFGEYVVCPRPFAGDNGAPFAARAVNGVSRLSLWWMKLGIRPKRIQAGHPEQNGRHERMHHCTLKQETAFRRRVLSPRVPSNVPLIGFVAITTNCVRMKRWPCNCRPPST